MNGEIHDKDTPYKSLLCADANVKDTASLIISSKEISRSERCDRPSVDNNENYKR
jgi:hypothetical protein